MARRHVIAAALVAHWLSRQSSGLEFLISACAKEPPYVIELLQVAQVPPFLIDRLKAEYLSLIHI